MLAVLRAGVRLKQKCFSRENTAALMEHTSKHEKPLPRELDTAIIVYFPVANSD